MVVLSRDHLGMSHAAALVDGDSYSAPIKLITVVTAWPDHQNSLTLYIPRLYGENEDSLLKTIIDIFRFLTSISEKLFIRLLESYKRKIPISEWCLAMDHSKH